jgi:hypothetical protein
VNATSQPKKFGQCPQTLPLPFFQGEWSGDETIAVGGISFSLAAILEDKWGVRQWRNCTARLFTPFFIAIAYNQIFTLAFDILSGAPTVIVCHKSTT